MLKGNREKERKKKTKNERKNRMKLLSLLLFWPAFACYVMGPLEIKKQQTQGLLSGEVA